MTGTEVSSGAAPAWSRAAVVAGLIALAVTQPVLDLLGNAPEFFVAGRYSNTQIIVFGVLVAVVPALVAAAVVLVSGWLHGRAGAVVYHLLVGGLGALFGNVLARGVGLDGGRVALAASLVGAAAALGLARVRPGRMLLELLSLANIFFLVGFLLMSPTSRLLSGGDEGDLGDVSVPTPPGPVVLIIFDELPLSTLLRGDGTVNGDRYPGFAALAERSTWYRNASAIHPRSERSVPGILTGKVVEPGQLPTHRDLPRNLLNLMATSMPVHRYESITDLCPPEACVAQASQPLSQALEDAVTVYGHRVLPARLRRDLPPIDTAWGGFGDAVGASDGDDDEDEDEDDGYFPPGAGGLARWHALDSSERSAASQAAALVEHGLSIRDEPAMHFVHVVLPHAPWVLTPWGTQLLLPVPEWVDDPAHPSFEASTVLRYQRHSLQVGAADAALTEVIDHLTEEGIWDDATVVVTADHGISLLPPDYGREPTDNNRDEVFRVPLFIKSPGQTEAAVVDDPALGLDVLPTLLDLLDIRTDWDVDGHSLLDGSDPTVEPFVDTDVRSLLEIARIHGDQFPLGDDWTGLAAVGAHGALVGTEVDDHAVGPESALSWAPTHRDAFDSLPTSTGGVPQVLTGTLSGSEERPPEIVVSVNGTIAGVGRGYVRQGDDAWAFFAFLGPYLVDGSNDVRAFEVGEELSGTTLHPLR